MPPSHGKEESGGGGGRSKGADSGRPHKSHRKEDKEKGSKEHKKSSRKKTDGGDAALATTAQNKNKATKDDSNDKEDEYDDDDDSYRILGIKAANLSRLLKVFLAFPYVIIVSAIRPTGRLAWMRSNFYIRLNNLMIYILPFFLTAFVLDKYRNPTVQIATVAAYMFLYLMPVAFVVFSKIDIVRTSTNIEDGTFCFKPARTVRFTEANFYQVAGFFFEWTQHVFYVLPVGVVTGKTQARIQDFPPYLPFPVYFWGCVASVFICCFILILNATLRGKSHHKFQRAGWIWYILFNIGQPMFMTIVTILYMGIWCDYSLDPPTLVQDPDMLCFGEEHTFMVRASLMTLALYVVQHTLLPSGTFKETMGDDTLEIMFVPVYMSANLLLKAVFCGIYVFYYQNNVFRIWSLTIINLISLWVNNSMNPCSIAWVNLARNTIFLHAALSGIQSVNYVLWPITDTTGNVLVSTLASNIVFTSVAMWGLHYANARGTEHAIATAFLDLEWQVAHGGNVNPRVLEPLISLTLSDKKEDWEIVKIYIDKLVWLLSHESTRVQFQSAWALANMALLEEDIRLKVHRAGGTRTLLEWYNEMDFPVQLEALAALANLSLSVEVCGAMVTKHKCIPFFLQIIVSNKIKHSHFALVSLGNISRIEKYRSQIMMAGGMHVLLGCIMTRDHLKLKFSALALANLLLSEENEIEEALRLRGLLKRIIKIAGRDEADTQQEVFALVRNLSCHPSIVESMLNKGIMKTVGNAKRSVYENVADWARETESNVQEHISRRKGQDTELSYRSATQQSLAATMEEARNRLGSMAPLEGRVEWSTWGSKLDAVFSPVFSHMPAIASQHVHAITGQGMPIKLSAGVAPEMMDTINNFTIIDVPGHGRLSEYETKSEFITYTPDAGFVGNDIFSYRAILADDQRTVPSSVTITITATSRMQKQVSRYSLGGVDSDNDDDSTSEIEHKRHGSKDSFLSSFAPSAGEVSPLHKGKIFVGKEGTGAGDGAAARPASSSTSVQPPPPPMMRGIAPAPGSSPLRGGGGRGKGRTLKKDKVGSAGHAEL